MTDKQQKSASENQKAETVKYDPSSIELKWQSKWQKDKVYQPDMDAAKKPFYNLMMFPYPSAEGMHVGNMYAFTGTDIYGRYKRMQGYDVFEPIGLDGFGIHSENYAMKVGRHPMENAQKAEENFYRQLRATGNGFAWDRTVETWKPEYYQWTQWVFIQLFKAGLAYRKKAAVNFCPSCKTVLSDEQAEGGKCERCGSVVERRDLEQWFFKITTYADRLLKNLDTIDWAEKVKIAQRKWIGKSEGAHITFPVKDAKETIEVFTTRPDTLYGVTFLVLSPEHQLVKTIKNNEVQDYVKAAQAKSDDERQAEGKEKTGVFSGLYAVNRINGEEIPVWIADYVLPGYGTGAIMAVPAHDQRDFEFAKKYNLPIREVIALEYGITRKNEKRRDGGCAVIFDPVAQKYAVCDNPDGLLRLFAGGVGEEEDMQTGVLREVGEESGLYDFSHVEHMQTAYVHFYNGRKNLNRVGKAVSYLVVLNSTKRKEQKLEEHELGLELVWKDPAEILVNWKEHHEKVGLDHWVNFLKQGVARAIELGYDTTNDPQKYTHTATTGKGVIINSGEWDDLRYPEDMDKIYALLEQKGIGKKEATYHLRDWLISRQRYWGPPIPMIYCEHCAKEGKSYFTESSRHSGERSYSRINEGSWTSQDDKFDMAGWYPVPDEQLPVALPHIEDFKPLGTGKAPLANYPDFYTVNCPACGKEARRETDVSDTFLDSAWYFFRYTSTEDTTCPWMPERAKKWLPVHMYIGGAEHSVLHLLYARFVTMVFKDLGLISHFEEPFSRFYAHGLLIKEGAKMSKSKGNVIIPDEYIRKFGADTLRTYLMFLGPFKDGGDFYDTGIEGVNKFLRRVWTLVTTREIVRETGKDATKALRHKTIKEVTDDMEQLRFNTAIAKLMSYYNTLSVQQELSHEDAKTLLALLAPFAPHMTEELWEKIGESYSIHKAAWPTYDEAETVADTVTIAVQVNGKVRDSLSVSTDTDQAQIEQQARNSAKIAAYLQGQTVKKVIYVPHKILNFVI